MQPLILLSGCNTPGFSHIQKKKKRKNIYIEREEDQEEEEEEEGGLSVGGSKCGKKNHFFTLYN